MPRCSLRDLYHLCFLFNIKYISYNTHSTYTCSSVYNELVKRQKNNHINEVFLSLAFFVNYFLETMMNICLNFYALYEQPDCFGLYLMYL